MRLNPVEPDSVCNVHKDVVHDPRHIDCCVSQPASLVLRKHSLASCQLSVPQLLQRRRRLGGVQAPLVHSTFWHRLQIILIQRHLHVPHSPHHLGSPFQPHPTTSKIVIALPHHPPAVLTDRELGRRRDLIILMVARVGVVCWTIALAAPIPPHCWSRRRCWSLFRRELASGSYGLHEMVAAGQGSSRWSPYPVTG